MNANINDTKAPELAKSAKGIKHICEKKQMAQMAQSALNKPRRKYCAKLKQAFIRSVIF